MIVASAANVGPIAEMEDSIVVMIARKVNASKHLQLCKA